MSDLRVAFVTLGCARNDVDSDELAARLNADGWQVVEDTDDADAVVVNTCGFVEAAKKDSIDTVLELHSAKRPVVAVGCLAERYGKELAAELPEASAVLGFDSYPDLSSRLRAVIAGETLKSHTPSDRRKLLPISPAARATATGGSAVPGHGIGRTRLSTGPTESVKIASGCDRRCSFCAIPSFRGSFISRRPTDIVNEARWLVAQGVREINLVSENSTSFGKDLGDLRLLEALLPELGGLHPDLRVRVAYLQPAEMRPELVKVIASTPGVARYFDMSFQHASPALLRRMRRFGGIDDFLGLIGDIRALAPEAGIRTNVIVGFPGETDDDIELLQQFLERAELDAVGVFGYSAEDGTEAASFTDEIPEDEIAARLSVVNELVDQLVDQRAEARVGDQVTVLIEATESAELAIGRAEHQGPEDGEVSVQTSSIARIGELVSATVIQNEGVDLIARR